MGDDATDVWRDPAAWVAALPEWGNLHGTGRECEHGPVIDHVRRVLGRLDADAVTELARHWRSLAARREATVAAWYELCTTWNRDMNGSFWRGDGGWEFEAYEPTVRVIEAIGSVLERAGSLGMSQPDPATVHAFARAFDLATHGTGQPGVAEFAGSLDVGPDAWSAALTCAAAISVSDTLVRPFVLERCLSALLATDPAAARVRQRCQHGRVMLAWADSTLGGEERYCAGDAWKYGWIQHGWPSVKPENKEGRPRGWFGLRPPKRDRDPWNQVFTGEPDPDMIVECECACACTWHGTWVEVNAEEGVMRCPGCLAQGHVWVGRFPAKSPQ